MRSVKGSTQAKPTAFQTGLLEGLAVVASGLFLYYAILLLEAAAGGPASSGSSRGGIALLLPVFIEEGAKLITLAAFALAVPALGAIAKLFRPSPEALSGLGPRLVGSRRSDAARGLSLGLVAISVFIAIENLAYFVAFPDRGIVLRLLWSAPVHLVAALAEALGAFPLLSLASRARGSSRDRGTTRDRGEGSRGRPSAKKGEGRNTGAVGAWLRLAAGFAFALAWHFAANLLASGQVSTPLLSAGVAANLILLAAFGHRFAYRVVIGGFLYGKK